MVREIHLADFTRSGSGESTALVTEQFVLDQSLGNCGAVQGHKRLLATVGQMVNRARKELLARATFAQQQRGGIGRSDALNLLANFANGSMLADNAGKTVTGCVLFAEQQIFAEELLLTRGALHQEFEMVEVDGFLKEIEGAFLHGRDSFFDGAERGQKNHRNGCVGVLGLAQYFETRSPRHFRSVMTRRYRRARTFWMAAVPSGASSTV